jgi:hypothetical protein
VQLTIRQNFCIPQLQMLKRYNSTAPNWYHTLSEWHYHISARKPRLLLLLLLLLLLMLVVAVLLVLLLLCNSDGDGDKRTSRHYAFISSKPMHPQHCSHGLHGHPENIQANHHKPRQGIIYPTLSVGTHMPAGTARLGKHP